MSTSCNPCCDDQVVENIPGPQGEAGNDGANGTDGQNAWTVTTAMFTMPDDDPVVDVTVSVANSDWMSPTQVLYIQGAGYMQIQSIPDSTSVILKNLGYTGNVGTGTNVASGKKVSASGLKGLDGAAGPGGAPASATYITQIPNADLSGEIALSTIGGPGIIEINAGGMPSIATDGTDYLSPSTGLANAAIGTTVQAFNALLAAISAEAPTVADRIIYTTGVNTVDLTTLTTLMRTLLADATAEAALLTLGRTKPRQGLLGSLSAIDLNVGATDHPVTITATRFRITEIVVEVTAIASTATVGLFLGAGGGGGTVAADQALNGATASDTYDSLTISSIGLTNVLTTTPLQFRVGTPQGSAVLADVWIYGQDFS